MITVYYDGKCNMCAREINHYRQLDNKLSTTSRFVWQDITESLGDLEQHNIDLITALKRMHVKDAQGRLHSGTEAFIVLWRQFPRWRWLARLVSTPGIKHLAELVYRVFAHYRFKHSAHCRLAADTGKLQEVP